MLSTGLFNSRQRLGEKAKREERLGSERPHLAGNIGDLKPIKDGQQETVEDRQGSRSKALTDLTGILAQRDITAPMKPIFNDPVSPVQLQEAFGTSLPPGQTRETIDPFLGTDQRFADPATQAKDLSDAWPGLGEKVVKFSGNHDLTALHSPMPALAGARGSPVVAIGGRLPKKQAQIFPASVG